jgi:hypothetical protein
MKCPSRIIIVVLAMSVLLTPAIVISSGLTPRDINGVEDAFGREELGGYSGEPPEVRFFYESNERPPKFEGEVEVLLEEPVRSYTSLGRIWLLRKTNRDTLLGQMKEVAARYGANAIILYTADPIEKSRKRLLWKSKAILVK